MSLDLNIFNDLYHVSENGVVISTKSNWRGYGARELSQSYNSDGYPSVRLTCNGKRHHIAVHRLVAFRYLPAKPNWASEIRHLDGNKKNNYYQNLCWGTTQQNADDRELHGTTHRKYKKGHLGYPGMTKACVLPEVGQIWRASNTHLLRYSIIKEISYDLGKVLLQKVVKAANGKWFHPERSKKKWARIDRFHGLRDGYEFFKHPAREIARELEKK